MGGGVRKVKGVGGGQKGKSSVCVWGGGDQKGKRSVCDGGGGGEGGLIQTLF